MKKSLIGILSIVIILSSSFPTMAQVRGKGEITKKSYNLESFDALDIGGARTVFLSNSNEYTVVVETHQNLQELVDLQITNGTLKFAFTKKVTNYDELNYYVTAPAYKKIAASGASDVSSLETLSGDDLKLVISGASDVKLDINYKNIITNVSGASDLTLSGKAVSSVVNSSGASDFHGKKLETTTSVVKASGASYCFVNATTSLNYDLSGASEVKYIGTPETIVVTKNKSKEVVVSSGNYDNGISDYDADTTEVNMGVMKVVVVDGDTTQVSVGRHTLSVSEDGDVNWKKCKVDRFNGHWGGVEIGINGYLTPNFDTDFAPADDYLSLRWEKSVNVNLNIYEQNINLSKNKNIGFITGIGLHWNNYRFSKQTYLTSDSTNIAGYYMDGVSVRKTKLTAMYITVPVLFEVQTRHPHRINRFHFAIGGQVSARISTHTKVYFNEANKSYDLLDPATGNPVATGLSPNSNSRNIVKNFNSYKLAPFKFDAMVRFGYGVINIFATYSLNTMFEKNRGPELYPFTAGITLVGW